MVGAGRSQAPAIRRVLELGCRVVAVDGDRAAPGLALASHAEVQDFSDADAVIEIGRRWAVDGVLSVASDRAVPIVATVAERLALPGIGPQVAERMTNKLLMREHLARGGVPQPSFAGVRTCGQARAALAQVGLPAVIKPADSGGQRGLSLVRTDDQLNEAFDAAVSFSQKGEVIVEQFCDGRELNAIVVVRSGVPTLVTLSDRRRPTGRGFGVGWLHVYPADISQALARKVTNVIAHAIRALGLREGIAFPQLIVSKDSGVQLIEIAARVAAGQMSDLVRVATGIDLVQIALHQCTGQPVPSELVTPARSQPLAIRFFTASPGVLPVGRVRLIEGLDDVRAAPGVLQAELYFGEGDLIRPLQVDDDRRGYVLAIGKNRKEALAHSKVAAERLRVSVDPSQP